MAPGCNDLDGFLATAENLVRISPHDESALSCLAEAHALKGDRAFAKAAYLRACELHPHLEFAGNALFDLQLEDNQLEAAEETLQRLARHVNSPFVVARMVQLHARQGRKEQALEALARVCTLPCESNWPVTAAVDAVMQANWSREALPVLESALIAPDVHPEVGAKWMHVAAAFGRPTPHQRLAEHKPKGELGQRAVWAFATYVSAHYGLQELTQFVRENADRLRSDTLVWGTTGYCLMDDPKAAVRWMHDWRSRADAQPWMLVNLVLALRQVRREPDAVEVSRRALENPDGDMGSLMIHRAWLAAEAAGVGNVQELHRLLAELAPEQLEEYYHPLYIFADAARSQRPRYQLEEVATGRLDPVMRRVYRRCVLTVGRHGGWTGRIWSWWRWLLSF